MGLILCHKDHVSPECSFLFARRETDNSGRYTLPRAIARPLVVWQISLLTEHTCSRGGVGGLCVYVCVCAHVCPCACVCFILIMPAT